MMYRIFTLLLPLTLLLFSCQKEQNQKIEVETLISTSKSWNGDELPNYPTTKPEIKILKYTIPGKTKLKIHQHMVINAGVLLKGKLTVFTETKDILHLETGDPIVELVNTWHYGMNENDEPAEIIVFYAGTEGTPIVTIKDDESDHIH